MPKYYYAAKKSRKKTKKANSTAWVRSALYILGGALCVWLFYILWINHASGKIGEDTARALSDALGQAAALLPLFLTYWLVQTIRKRSSSFLLFLIGTGITLSASASLFTCLRLIFSDSLLSGGKVGEKIFYTFKMNKKRTVGVTKKHKVKKTAFFRQSFY